MLKAWRVARTEYANAVRSKAFLIGIILLPVFMFGGIVIPELLKNKIDIKPRRVAVWDRSGQLAPVLASRAAVRNEREIFEGSDPARRVQIRPAFLLEAWQPPVGKAEQAEFVLSDRVRDKQLFGFVIIGRDALAADGGADAEIAYYTETPTYTDLPNWIERVLNEEIARVRIESANLDRQLVGKLTRHTPVKKMGLSKVTATGELIKAQQENPLRTFAVPFGSMFLLFMLVMSSAPALMQTVLEEKQLKIAEVLVSSVTPFELMLGKLMGVVLVAWTLSCLYLGAVALSLYKYGMQEMVPVSLYFWFLLFQLLALLIYGSFFSAIGAACSELRDAQSLMGPAMFIVILPMFVWMPIMQSPMSAFARIASLLPPLTPMLMLLRLAVPPGPPWWEVALSVLLTTGFMLLSVWAAAKIFRIGILAQGQAPTFRRLLGWLWSR